MKLQRTVLLTLLVSSLVAIAQDPPPRFTVGQPFPTLTLPSLDGRPTSIAAYRGKKVLLHIFASW